MYNGKTMCEIVFLKYPVRDEDIETIEINKSIDGSQLNTNIQLYKPIVLLKNLMKATKDFKERLINKKNGNSIYNEKINDWKKQLELLLKLIKG